MPDRFMPLRPVSVETSPFIRTARPRLTILTGEEVLLEGGELVRRLWNKARSWQRQYRFDHYSFAPWTELQAGLRRDGFTYGLNDRCFSYALRRFNANLMVWDHSRQPDLQPPGYAHQPQPILFEVGRNAKPVGPWTYRLSVLNKKQPIRHALVKLQLRPGIKMAQVKMIQVQPDLRVIVTYYRHVPPSSPGSGIAGVDLGIANLAAVAFQSGECALYSGQGLLTLERQAREQSSGLEKRSPRYGAIWSRVRHIRRLALHHLTNSIIRECLERQVGTIVVGNLKHIRQNKRHQTIRMWAFACVVAELRYKGLEHGLEVIQVDEGYTSRRCHWCNGSGRRIQRQRQFCCSNCGRRIDADVNAAFNILSKRTPLPIYAWGISPNPGLTDDLPVIGPTHRACFTQAYRIDLTPVTAVEPLNAPSLLAKGRLTRPAEPRSGKRGNRPNSGSV